MSPQTQALTVGSNNTPAFLADATSSIEKMEAYANLLIKSGLVPKHFYELDQWRNPIKDAQGVFKGNTAAVIMTIQHGLELGMSITQSLQQIVPVNGLMSVKGDAAKALIMRSGLCKEWIEEEVGTHGTDAYGLKISSKRTDGQSMTRTFTVQDAKRAGLWIDDNAVAKNEKLRHSPWYKYQSRMLRYRALGFMARDLYGDVLQNMYTEDEARDIEVDNTVMTTSDGMTVSVAEDKSAKTNEAAAETLKTKNPSKKKSDSIKNAGPAPVVYEDAVWVEPESGTRTEENPVEQRPLTKSELDAMTTSECLQLCNNLLGVDVDETPLFVGANKTKRIVGWLKKIILAFQDGTLDNLLETEFKITRSQLVPVRAVENMTIEIPTVDPSTETVDKPKLLDQISEVEEGQEREFEEVLELDRIQKELKIGEGSIMKYISDNSLDYNTREGFFKGASLSHISAAFML